MKPGSHHNFYTGKLETKIKLGPKVTLESSAVSLTQHLEPAQAIGYSARGSCYIIRVGSIYLHCLLSVYGSYVGIQTSDDQYILKFFFDPKTMMSFISGSMTFKDLLTSGQWTCWVCKYFPSVTYTVDNIDEIINEIIKASTGSKEYHLC